MNDISLSSSSLHELQGLRLIRAFLRIRTETQRLELLRLADEFAGESIDDASHAISNPQIVPRPVTFPEKPS